MPEDDAKSAILRRRARFIAAALATAGLVTVTEGCGDDGSTSSNKGDAALGGGGTGAQACLSPPLGGAGSGGTAGSAAGAAGTTQTGGAGGADASDDAAGGFAGFQPCLAPPPEGGTSGDASGD